MREIVHDSKVEWQYSYRDKYRKVNVCKRLLCMGCSTRSAIICTISYCEYFRVGFGT